MFLYAKPFTESKRGNSPDQNEDAVWIPANIDMCSGEFVGDAFRVVLADGASESLLARHWALHLTQTFGAISEPPFTEEGFVAAYEAAAVDWPGIVAAYVQGREDHGSPISWYHEAKLERGAYATIVLLELSSNETWHAAALGDSCLFHVRDGRLMSSFPMTDSTSFSLQPPLLRSREPDWSLVRSHLCLQEGEWQAEDKFFLASDALASWVLARVEDNQPPWQEFTDLYPDEAQSYSQLVAQARDDGALKNDDTTMVRVEVCS